MWSTIDVFTIYSLITSEKNLEAVDELRVYCREETVWVWGLKPGRNSLCNLGQLI